MRKISLNIDSHETSILIGRALFTELKLYEGRKILFLVDENVFSIHYEVFSGRECIIIPSGEKHKTLRFAEEVLRKMVELEIDRTSFLIGVGGGLVTDLAGFVASTYMRGIRFGFISTTLLGQVDASIGGKNGVNLDGFKNMIGVIRQPEFVWCDLDLLESLDPKELVSGFSEVIKYGAIKDKLLFEFLENNYEDVLNLHPESLEKVVAESARLKVQIVESDVMEQGMRKLLNFGHTLGHAIEKLTGVLHGEAIAIGMVLAARLSVKMSFLTQEEAVRLEKLLSASGLPVSTDIPPKELYNALLKDKKRAGTTIHFVLLHAIGNAFIHEIQLDSLKAVMYDLY